MKRSITPRMLYALLAHIDATSASLSLTLPEVQDELREREVADVTVADVDAAMRVLYAGDLVERVEHVAGGKGAAFYALPVTTGAIFGREDDTERATRRRARASLRATPLHTRPAFAAMTAAADAKRETAQAAQRETQGETRPLGVLFGELPLGQRVRLRRDVERFPHFVARAGMTGEVTEASAETFVVTLDEILPGAEDWDNAIVWSVRDGEDPLADVEPIAAGA